jgi:NADH:ubiquinone reductase (H+-translocating)
MNRKRIVILVGGFGGVTVLNKLQNRFQTDVSVDIALISKDNYLLFTPMLLVATKIYKVALTPYY